LSVVSCQNVLNEAARHVYVWDAIHVASYPPWRHSADVIGVAETSVIGCALVWRHCP